MWLLHQRDDRIQVLLHRLRDEYTYPTLSCEPLYLRDKVFHVPADPRNFFHFETAVQDWDLISAPPMESPTRPRLAAAEHQNQDQLSSRHGGTDTRSTD
ncbi:MAG: hypothetical protein BRD35_01545 [Bacteroidetes bacterium QH_7_62_13]|nr:MAG: hypothetical protein BRD35_01545 [Bacteroidetes bacterium QH_7_62_13]